MSTKDIKALIDNANPNNKKETGTDQKTSKETSSKKKREVKPPEHLVKPVNMGIKIPKYQRDYWTGQAKMNGITITEIFTEALIEYFGEPPKPWEQPAPRSKNEAKRRYKKQSSEPSESD